MGITLNSAHHSYQSMVHIIYVSQEITSNVYSMKNSKSQLKILCWSKASDKFQDVDDSSTRIEVEKKYKDDFKEALRVQTSVITTNTGLKVKFPMCFMCMIGVGQV